MVAMAKFAFLAISGYVEEETPGYDNPNFVHAIEKYRVRLRHDAYKLD
jgi:hypothetical protein